MQQHITMSATQVMLLDGIQNLSALFFAL